MTVARAADLVTEWCTGEGGPDRVGLELEWLTVRADDGGQPDLATLEAVIAATSPAPAGSRLTLEPGGQLEVSAPPFDDVRSAIAAAATDAAALEAAAEPRRRRAAGPGQRAPAARAPPATCPATTPWRPGTTPATPRAAG